MKYRPDFEGLLRKMMYVKCPIVNFLCQLRIEMINLEGLPRRFGG